MATVTGLTAARMQEIIDATVASAAIVGDNLILTLEDASTINAGNVRGPVGPAGATFTVCTSGTRPGSPTDGLAIYETDTKLVRIWNGTRWRLQEKIICTSTTRPTLVSGDEGVKIYETDTDLEYTWTGTIWFLTSANMPLFANAAARDAAISGGDRKLGMTVWQTAEGGLFTWNGSAWKAQPNGELGSVKITSNSAAFGFSAGTPVSTTYRISGYAITVNVPANRILEIQFDASATLNYPDITSVGVWRGTTQIAQRNTNGPIDGFSMFARSTGVSGSQTFYIYGWVNAIVTTNIVASAVYPAYMTVRDVGST